MVDYVDSVSDSISLTESVTRIAGLVRVASDTIAISDAQSSVVGVLGICSETIFLSEEAGSSGWGEILLPNQSWVTVSTT